MNLEEQKLLNQRNRGIIPQEEKKYWFIPKPYGIGVIPVTWEGWGVSLLFGAFIFGLAWWNGLVQEVEPVSIKAVFLFLFEVTLSMFGFIHITKDRVEGGLKWRWGLKK